MAILLAFQNGRTLVFWINISGYIIDFLRSLRFVFGLCSDKIPCSILFNKKFFNFDKKLNDLNFKVSILMC